MEERGFLGDKFSGFQGEPSANAWNAINQNIQPPKRKFWGFIVFASLLLGSIGLGFWYSEYAKQRSTQLVQSNADKKSIQNQATMTVEIQKTNQEDGKEIGENLSNNNSFQNASTGQKLNAQSNPKSRKLRTETTGKDFPKSYSTEPEPRLKVHLNEPKTLALENQSSQKPENSSLKKDVALEEKALVLVSENKEKNRTRLENVEPKSSESQHVEQPIVLKEISSEIPKTGLVIQKKAGSGAVDAKEKVTETIQQLKPDNPNLTVDVFPLPEKELVAKKEIKEEQFNSSASKENSNSKKSIELLEKSEGKNLSQSKIQNNANLHGFEAEFLIPKIIGLVPNQINEKARFIKPAPDTSLPFQSKKRGWWKGSNTNWSIFASFYYNTKNLDIDQNKQESALSLDNNSFNVSRVSADMGLHIEKPVNRHLSLVAQPGFGFWQDQTNIKITENTVSSVEEVRNGSQITLTPFLKSSVLQNKMNGVFGQLGTGLHWKPVPVFYSAFLGINAILPLMQNTQSVSETGSAEKLEWFYRNPIVSASASLSYSIWRSSKYVLYIEPQFQYFFSPLFSPVVGIENRPIQSGFRLRLKIR